MTATRDDGAPPVFQPPPGNPRFPLLDAMRGIAALMIVLTHAGLLSGANLHAAYGRYTARLDMGLTVFFVVSGFVIYRPYVAGRLGVGRASRLRDYARNRVLRIVPAYWLALTLLAVFPGLTGFWSGHSWSYYLFLQPLDASWFHGGIKPAWSISVDMSYYAVLPLLAWLMARAARGRPLRTAVRYEALLFALLVAIGVAYRVLVRRVGGDDPLSNAWAFLPGSIDWIAVGMGMAALSAALDAGVRRPRLVTLVERRPALAWVAAAVLFWVVSTRIGVDGRFPQPTTTLGWTAMHELYAAVAALIVAPAVFGHERGGAVRRFLRVRALAWLGLVSYGIFLYHHPIMEALATSRFARHWRDFPMLGLTATTLVLATACAAASYFLFERPILRLKRTRRSERRALGKPTPEPVGPAL